MNKNLLVSIIINNYNYGHFLKEAIDSAINQTHDNIEVIVVDDGSTDNSRDVIKSYGDRVIAVFKENGGQGSAYNAGFFKSHGQLICNLDADDTLLPTAMARNIPFFENQEIVKVQWPLWIVDSSGIQTKQMTTKSAPPEGDLKEFVLRDGPFYDFNFHVGSVVKRTFLENIFPMPEPPYRNGGDVYLTTLAPIFGQIRNIMEPLGTYRAHGANNYFGRELDENRIRNYIARFETNCNALQKYAKKLGIDADSELWKKRNFNYLWPQRLLQAKKDIESLIPEGKKYILVNEDEWGRGEPVPNRHAILFLERDGEYAGFPVDDTMAIRELERLRDLGTHYLIFWWTQFWWFEHYARFYEYVCSVFPCVLKNDRLVVFDLHQRIS